jgi:dCMP deaminase
MKKPSWDEYFMKLAYTVACRSECLDKQVGCVIIDRHNRIIGTGYNGFPTGAPNPCEKACEKDQGKPCGMVHAEMNAMLYTNMERAHRMYITLPPCENCLRHIMNSPVKRISLPSTFKGSDKCLPTGKGYDFVDTTEPVFYKNQWFGLCEAFDKIREYHKTLGYPKEHKSEVERFQQFRDLIVALNQEVAELCDSFPWKPWRLVKDQGYDEENAIQELVDIMFFMGSVLELFEISPERFEKMLHWKIAENYNRIQRGYNKSKEDM